ncbi:hypothetical protein J6590_050090 [Homalodisca vitripennis]|nr:hypothetical protein J6590_050090 [Homalodisca vitripennis]
MDWSLKFPDRTLRLLSFSKEMVRLYRYDTGIRARYGVRAVNTHPVPRVYDTHASNMTPPPPAIPHPSTPCRLTELPSGDKDDRCESTSPAVKVLKGRWPDEKTASNSKTRTEPVAAALVAVV